MRGHFVPFIMKERDTLSEPGRGNGTARRAHGKISPARPGLRSEHSHRNEGRGTVQLAMESN